jgi:hypothetical protein
MAGTGMRFRAEWRAHWLSIVGVALLAGVAGGVVLVAVAGARRTDTTLARVARFERIPDVLVNPDGNDASPGFVHAYSAIDRLPGITTVVPFDAYAVLPLNHDGTPDTGASHNEIDLAPSNDAFGQSIDRTHIVAGRASDPARVDEVVINEAKARRSRLQPGDHLRLGVFDAAELFSGSRPSVKFAADFKIVGISTRLDDTSRAPDDPNLLSTAMFTPAFHRRVAALTPLFVGKEVALANGERGVAGFEAAVRQLFVGVKVNQRPLNIVFQEPALTTARVRRSVRPYVVALWLFAVLAALAGLAVVGQAVARSTRPLRDDRDKLRAIGFTQGQLVASAAVQGLVTGTIGAACAFVIAVVASQFMPIGPLRSIDPEPGIRLDAAVLGAGTFLIVGFTVLIAVLSLRTRRRAPDRVAPAVGVQIARLGAPVTIASGVHFAFDRGRDGGVPLRSTLVGITVALAALVVALVYGAGLTRFADSPVRYGWPWTYQVIVHDEQPDALARKLATLRGVADFAPGFYSQFEIGKQSVAAVGLDHGASFPFLPLLSGRAPVADDEVVLGAKTMAALHTHVGATIPVVAQSLTKQFRVVGEAVFPRFAAYQGSEPTGLGIGAATTAHAIRALRADNGAPFFSVRTKPGQLTTPDAFTKALGSRADPDNAPEVLGPQRPNDVMSYDRLSRTPLVLAGVLALLALGSAIHLLVTGVRGRRRDVALLKTMGVTRGQARATVLVQATVLVSLALVVAIPLGVVAGRWLWTRTAHWLGIAADPVFPVGALFVVTVVVILLANVIAFGPAAIAARTRPAIALRSE